MMVLARDYIIAASVRHVSDPAEHEARDNRSSNEHRTQAQDAAALLTAA